MNIPDVTYNDIKDNMDIISKKITNKDINDRFNHGFIFYEDFKDLIYEIIPKITEEDINKLFAFFDQYNMNLFIYVRDFIKYLNQGKNKKEKNSVVSLNNNINKPETGQIKKKYDRRTIFLNMDRNNEKNIKIIYIRIRTFP